MIYRGTNCVRLGLFFLLTFSGLVLSGYGAAQSYKITHCYQGCPEGTSDSNHLVIRPIYTLSYNTNRKSADWVAYKVSVASIGIASSLPRLPRIDSFVPDTLTGNDFLRAEIVGMVRSQYVPIVDFAGTPYWNEVNYLTNSVAQTKGLAQGAWNGLDWAVRNLVNREGEAYVLTGPIFKTEPTVSNLPADAPHRVPDAFFKIIITRGLGAAFMLEQDSPIYLHHCEQRTS
ncbi:MAG: hypothetical protein CMP90_05785, partial [Gammaproteobacteria bacterium]|nr:hypothetical protein [Gammaproteobacteria bacterium]